MDVLGKNCFIFDNIQSRTCKVEPFDPTIGTAKHVPIVNAAVSYDCPYSHQMYILMLHNALYVPTMTNNLILPFLLREAGVICNDVPKIHFDNPGNNDHAIIVRDSNLQIPLQLWGVFSFFHTRSPTSDELTSCKKIITPDSTLWNPYSDHYVVNKESMLDYEGNIIETKYRKKHIIDMPPSISVTLISFYNAIDQVIDSTQPDTIPVDYDSFSMAEIEMASILSAFTNQHQTLLIDMTCGSTTIPSDDTKCDIFINDFNAKIDATIGSKPSTVSANFLSKIWNIDQPLPRTPI
jgi:hypothetical protein